MHELGIIMNMSKTLESCAAENHLDKIDAFTLELGEVSGIIPELLVDCWQYFRKKSMLLHDTEMKIEKLPAVTYCEDCKGEYETVIYGKTCPYCKSGNTYLLRGNECNIKEIIIY